MVILFEEGDEDGIVKVNYINFQSLSLVVDLNLAHNLLQLSSVDVVHLLMMGDDIVESNVGVFFLEDQINGGE